MSPLLATYMNCNVLQQSSSHICHMQDYTAEYVSWCILIIIFQSLGFYTHTNTHTQTCFELRLILQTLMDCCKDWNIMTFQTWRKSFSNHVPKLLKLQTVILLKTRHAQCGLLRSNRQLFVHMGGDILLLHAALTLNQQTTPITLRNCFHITPRVIHGCV